jgi:hypothetical protein
VAQAVPGSPPLLLRSTASGVERRYCGPSGGWESTSPPPPTGGRCVNGGQQGHGGASTTDGVTGVLATQLICRCYAPRQHGTTMTMRLGARSVAASSSAANISALGHRHTIFSSSPYAAASAVTRVRGVAWGHAPTQCVTCPVLRPTPAKF